MIMRAAKKAAMNRPLALIKWVLERFRAHTPSCRSCGELLPLAWVKATPFHSLLCPACRARDLIDEEPVAKSRRDRDEDDLVLLF
jgi:hypothetical protein